MSFIKILFFHISGKIFYILYHEITLINNSLFANKTTNFCKREHLCVYLENERDKSQIFTLLCIKFVLNNYLNKSTRGSI